MTGLQARVEVTAGTFTLRAEVDAQPGATLAILGPNGAGKSTLLRALAGLVPLENGLVRLNEAVLEDTSSGVRVEASERNVGLVFQDRALFPHLDALDNVAFAARAAGRSASVARQEASRWLERLGLPEDRWRLRPEALSGGMAQRVALARTLARPTQLTLIDEPLAAVDLRSRPGLTASLAAILDERPGVNVIVTHDMGEALALARNVLVLEDGVVTHVGDLGQVLSEPRTEYVAALSAPPRDLSG